MLLPPVPEKTKNRFKEVHDIKYNLITIQEPLFEIKFQKYGNFAHLTFFAFFSKL